jgi:hypothetical protein
LNADGSIKVRSGANETKRMVYDVDAIRDLVLEPVAVPARNFLAALDGAKQQEGGRNVSPSKVVKWGPFALWHRVRRGHWFEPLSWIIPDYCRTCLKAAIDRD